MKKLTPKMRQWQEIHTRKMRRREFHSTRRPPRVRNKRESITISCPEVFSLDANFDEVVRVLNEIRDVSRRFRPNLYIDFRPIRDLSVSAALAFAAELDRFKRVCGPLRPVDVREWEPTVLNLLDELGFFELLHVKTKFSSDEQSNATKYVRFRSGSKADGEKVDELRKQDLEPLVGDVPGRTKFYAALTEAMTNVAQHAYENESSLSLWWLSASFSRVESELTILIYDQGLGIPHTLQKKGMERLRDFLPLTNSHSAMIRAAHDIERTASQDPNRGFGLNRDIRGYAEYLDGQVMYRVFSLKGEYTCVKSVDNDMDHELKDHRETLKGTLIEWKLKTDFSFVKEQ